MLAIVLIILIFSGSSFVYANYTRITSYLERHYGKPKVAENIRVTFKEGSTNLDMAVELKSKLPNFDSALFLKTAAPFQGYLFPDTYLFYKTETPDSVIARLRDTFTKKSPSKDEEIIIMASILEKEAGGKDDMQLISGILWKRISKGIALQVDAAPSTYESRGLPPSPISNPGKNSILASMNPIESGYWYYLHDKNGIVHFAKSYDEHRANIRKYLQ